MSIQVQFGPEATAEVRDAMRWYQQRRAGLGFSFLTAVDAAVDSLKRWSRSGAPIVGLEAFDVRRVPISSFPYHVAYLIVGERIEVLAIAHDRRRPVYWSGRVNP